MDVLIFIFETCEIQTLNEQDTHNESSGYLLQKCALLLIDFQVESWFASLLALLTLKSSDCGQINNSDLSFM